MSYKLMFYVGILGAGAVAVGVNQADLKMNYVETDATVTASKLECYIENSKSKIVEKDTGKKAYMDCKLAPLVAAAHDHDESDIHRIVRFEYRYLSPADGSSQKGKGSRTKAVDDYKIGRTVQIYAHKEEPGKSRVR